MKHRICAVAASAALLAGLCAQQPPPGSPPAPAATASQLAPPTATVIPVPSGKYVLDLQGSSLRELIDTLARSLKINYIIDPRIGGGAVSVKTYGELREVDLRPLLDTILRINGAAMIQVGDLYRIVPLADVSRLPMRPMVNNQAVPEDEQMALNLIFLKYAMVGELSKLLEKFLGEGASMVTYEPANLMLVLDNNRSMRRTMELIALFDSDTLASQRVKLYEVKNGSPSDIAKELETIFRSISLGEKSSAVKFMPLERINTIIAVAPNPGVFEAVETWLKKLDVKVQVTVGSVDNYVYRVKYGQADMLAYSIMQLYMETPSYGGGPGYGGYGGGAGGYGIGGSSSGMGLGAGGNLRSGMGAGTAQQGAGAGGAAGLQQGTSGTTGSPFDMSGSYLGAGGGYGGTLREGAPRVVPNMLDNSLLIQATPQEYEKILKVLKELDVPPRQVLIEAKIYEVTLTGSFASGVTAYLQRQNSNDLGVLTASEDNRKTKVISAPVVIATDSVPASINVGQDVPTLASQALTGAQQSGSSLFANTIQSRSSGVTLDILARVNASGIVTMVINQEVSSPVAPAASAAIQSPSFSTRTIQTQVTVQDGDTIAIGGIIKESDTYSSAGVPFLHRIPILGAAFGAKSTSKERTELVVFMTPRVIYDTNGIAEASDELKSKLKRLTKIIQE
jgi:general secretion pathway protein D